MHTKYGHGLSWVIVTDSVNSYVETTQLVSKHFMSWFLGTITFH